MSAAPPISVILVCKNPGPRLHAALESVWTQLHVAPEIIVVDGASTDGSREWLEARRGRLTTLISEPDTGIYDAMNKGLARAHGDWVLFLGADDRLVGDIVLSETLNWMKKTEAGVVAGEAAYDDGRIYKFGRNTNPVVRNFVHHQSTFYRRTLFEENGEFDTSLAIMADYELNVRLWKNRVRFKPIPLRIAACGSHGASDAGHWRGYREEIAVRHRYFSLNRCLWWDAMSVLRYVRKKIVRSLFKH
jgi:glycosyltransferase involved in cell wall biosynthesis